jgi:hypothetical protein
MGLIRCQLLGPDLARNGHTGAFTTSPLLREQRTWLGRGAKSEIGRVEMWRGGVR